MSTAAVGARPVPRDGRIEASLALFRKGYCFIGDTCRDLDSDLFETRLLLAPTICCLGRDAAELVYDERLFERRDAMPMRVQKTLIGERGVQTLDGAAHTRRKQLLLGLLGWEAAQDLRTRAAAEWRRAAQRWQTQPRVVLFDESLEVLCRAACGWAAVPLPERDAAARTRAFAAMIAGSGAVGVRHWRARRARSRLERWAEDLIVGARASGAPGALGTVAAARDSRGALLNARVAAVELLNLLRPVVAVAYFVTFAALALHRYPGCRDALVPGDHAAALRFVQEVRRFYPFFPFVAARVRQEFEARGYRFPRGRRVLLDLYGTNHDPRIWRDPELFRPERFVRFRDDGFSLIPQGGGDYAAGHRCAGERVTVELMLGAVELLTRSLSYRVPPQEDGVDLRRMPARPRSGLVLTDVALAD